MGQDDPGLPPFDEEIVIGEASNDIEDIDKLATTP